MMLSGSELNAITLQPLRVYRIGLEEEYLLKSHNHLGIASAKKSDENQAARFMQAAKKIASDAAWYQRQVEAEQRKNMSDVTAGVTHAVVCAVRERQWSAFRPPGAQPGMQLSEKIRAAVTTFESGLENLRINAFHEWREESQTSFIKSWRTLGRALIGCRRIVVCTAGNALSPLMTEAFSHCKHVVIILDEASLCTDPALWSVIVNLFEQDRIDSQFDGKTPIRAVVIVGDHHQGRAVVKSEHEPFNTFGRQLPVSTFLRAVMTGFPVEGMYEQFRMPETLCMLPNKRCYGGKLRTGEAKKVKQMQPAMEDFIIEQFDIDIGLLSQASESTSRQYTIDQHVRMQLLNVPSGQCQGEPHTLSRFNMANVDVAMRFLEQLVVKLVNPGHAKISEIKILTFYNAQKRRMINALIELGKRLRLTAADLGDVVHTSDSFQGQEADLVILDTTICSYTGQGTLGHVGDELKFNVAATRAKECLFVIGNLSLLNSDIIAQQEKKEFVVELLQTLQTRKAYKNFASNAKPEKIVGAKFDHEIEKVTKEDELTSQNGVVEGIDDAFGDMSLKS